MSAIRFRDVVKNFGKAQVLRGISFDVPKNCIAGLVGPNGAGKSTTLKIAIGALRRDYGVVEVLGYDPWAEPRAVRRLTGFLPESPQFPHVRVADLLTYVAKIKVGSGAEIEVRRVVRLVGLREILYRSADRLSAGFRQRLALALALIGEPKLLILDEPAANLDPGARAELYELLKTLRKDYGITILLSTHILAEARDVVDYLMIISRGVIVAEGWVSELVKELKLGIRAVFRLRRGIDVRKVASELLHRYSVSGVRIEDDKLVVEADSETMNDVREYLASLGIEIIEERSMDLAELYRKLVGGR